MALPGVTDDKELKLLLKQLLDNQEAVFKFAVVASGPREGALILSKKEKLRTKEVQQEAEAEAKTKNGGKAVKLDVISGECRLHAPGTTTLRLIVQGKAVARAVACAEHLLARGPYKAIGFTGVILEEVEAATETAPTAESTVAATTAETTSNPSALFAERLAGLLPEIKAAIGTPSGDEAKLRASEAGVAARKQDFTLANQLLDQVESLLKSASSSDLPADLAARFNEQLKALLPAIQAAVGTPPGDDAKLHASQAAVFARKKDFAQAHLQLDLASAALQSVNQVAGDRPFQSQPESTSRVGGDELEAMLADWTTARQTVLVQVKTLATAIAKSGHPEADAGVILLKSIAANLTERPTTARQVNELIRYLETDEVIADAELPNPFDVRIAIRVPLMEVLGRLSQRVA